MRESKIEKAVKKHAEENGWLVFKFTSPNRKGVPDNVFGKKNRRQVYPEFKATGKTPTKLQARTFAKMRKHGFYVPVIDSIEKGKKIFT